MDTFVSPGAQIRNTITLVFSRDRIHLLRFYFKIKNKSTKTVKLTNYTAKIEYWKNSWNTLKQE